MARSSKQDVLDKFRFEIQVIQLDLNLLAATEALGNLFSDKINQTFGTNPFVVLSRSGFNEITLPKASVNIINYRENLDNQRFSKSPGLVKYDPVVLKRGATSSSELFQWYQMVSNDTVFMATAQELTKYNANIPSQDEHFRREVLIKVNDRDGSEAKQWMLFNAWPSAYKGGNDLNAQAEEKLIEELTLEYEFFIEFKGGWEGFARELAKSAINFAGTVGLNAVAKAVPFVKDI
jgi:phage tail-like protein